MKLELNNYIRLNPHFDEIDLFQEVANYLSRSYRCTFINETHQQYVRFNSSVSGCRQRRELSDLWIITYSPSRQQAKMTFLQAKLKKNLRAVRIPFSFRGDYFQFDLLSTRPLITDLSKFGFPQDILSNAVLESVGTYGIFFYDNTRNIDFAFSTATELRPTARPVICTTGERTLYFPNINHGHAQFLYSHSEIELRCSLDADYFELCLLNLFVGTPILNDINLISYLRSFLSTTNSNNTTVNDFLNFINEVRPINNNDFDFQKQGNPRILLINVDPFEQDYR